MTLGTLSHIQGVGKLCVKCSFFFVEFLAGLPLSLVEDSQDHICAAKRKWVVHNSTRGGDDYILASFQDCARLKAGLESFARNLAFMISILIEVSSRKDSWAEVGNVKYASQSLLDCYVTPSILV